MARLEIILYILKGFYAKSGKKELEIKLFKIEDENEELMKIYNVLIVPCLFHPDNDTR